MDSKQKNLLTDLSSVLKYHQGIGVKEYPLTVADHVLEEEIRVLQKSQKGTPSSSKGGLSMPSPSLVAETAREIEDEVRECTSCQLYEKKTMSVPGNGGHKIKIFFVGGWLVSSNNDELLKESVFGIEEDAMVSRMLTAISLSRDQAFLTNVIKCGIPSSVQPIADNIHACSSYLYRQVAALSPDIICTMGIIATRVFLDIPRPLSQLRGRCYTHTTVDKKEIPLLPTYHPTFLLQNPEMKKATWIDLQLIEKELKKFEKN